MHLVKEYPVKPNIHGIQTQKVLPSHDVLFIRQFILLLAAFCGGYFFSAVTLYVSSATSKSGRCHFLQFIDGGSWGPENKAQAFEFLRCFLALPLSFSSMVTNAQANAASSREGPLLLHGKQGTNKTSKLVQKALLQTAGGLARPGCSWQSRRGSPQPTLCLVALLPPQLKLPPSMLPSHAASRTPSPDHTHTRTHAPPSSFPLNFGVPKWHQVGTPMSWSGASTYAEAAHAAGYRELN